jgi:hypothetical protein
LGVWIGLKNVLLNIWTKNFQGEEMHEEFLVGNLLKNIHLEEWGDGRIIQRPDLGI